MRVSVIIPVFNERDTLPTVLERLASSGVNAEQILVVDDGSTDGTAQWLAEETNSGKIATLAHERNRGKGAAIATALPQATGDFVVIQDADLEYDPADLPELLAPLREDRADVVFGTRFAGGKVRQVAYHRQRWGNWLLTTLSNWLTGLDLTDMECGYKAFRRNLIRDMTLVERGFGFEPEITAKLARRRPRVYEVPVSYHGRTYNEGKKIRLRDGLRAVYAIAKYNLWDRR